MTLTVTKPAHLWVPECAVGTYGDEAADLSASYGRELDPEQRIAVDAILSFKKGGAYAAIEAAIIESRQNGKTGGVMLACSMYDLFVGPPDKIPWTAHLFKTSRASYLDAKQLIQSTPDLDREIARFNDSHGEEGIYLKSGASLEFMARSKGGGRGLGGKRINMDESLFLNQAAMAALFPTMAARPDAQILYGSSAGIAESAVLRSLRDRGRACNDPTLVYVEWCAPEGGCKTESCEHALDADGCALDDERNWEAANPAIDRRITRDYIRSERRALTPEDFARERLGWWSDPGTADMPYPVKDWNDLVDRPSQLVGSPTFAIDTNPSRTHTAIAVCGDREDDLDHLEVAVYAPGTAWVVGKAVELHEQFGATFYLTADGAAASLAPGLAEANVPYELVNAREMVAACGSMYDAIQAKSFRHLAQEELDDAIVMARKRYLEGAWALARKGGDIAPLVAAVLARHFHELDQSYYDLNDSFA